MQNLEGPEKGVFLQIPDTGVTYSTDRQIDTYVDGWIRRWMDRYGDRQIDR